MPKGRKRTSEEYEREIQEASKRMRKHKESLRASRDSESWIDFVRDVMDIPIETQAREVFFEKVREDVQHYDREFVRRTSYAELREAGFTAKQARQMRDWSKAKRQVAIENVYLL